MASGTGGQIAFARINSLYHDVNTVHIGTTFVSETLEHKLNEIEEGAISGRRSAPISYKGIDMGDGDINLEPNPNVLAWLLKGVMGTVASSLVTNAGSTGANSGQAAGKPYWYHSFTPRQNAYSDRTFLEPHNVMIYRDVGSAWLFKGAVLPSLKLDIEAGALAKATLGVMARTVDRIQRTAAIGSLSNVSAVYGGRPWVWDMASIEISTDTTSANLAAVTNYEKISFNYQMQQEGTAFLDGTKKYGEFNPSDFNRIAIEGTMSFRDHTEYAAFTAYESRRMRITFLNVNSAISLGNIASLDTTLFLGYYGLRLHIPRMKFLTWGAPIGGPNRLTASFTAKAEYDDTDGLMIQADMNTVLAANTLNYASS